MWYLVYMLSAHDFIHSASLGSEEFWILGFRYLLLMEEILYHLGCIKPGTSWDKLPFPQLVFPGFQSIKIIRSFPPVLNCLLACEYAFLRCRKGQGSTKFSAKKSHQEKSRCGRVFCLEKAQISAEIFTCNFFGNWDFFGEIVKDDPAWTFWGPRRYLTSAIVVSFREGILTNLGYRWWQLKDFLECSPRFIWGRFFPILTCAYFAKVLKPPTNLRESKELNVTDSSPTNFGAPEVWWILNRLKWTKNQWLFLVPIKGDW